MPPLPGLGPEGPGGGRGGGRGGAPAPLHAGQQRVGGSQGGGGQGGKGQRAHEARLLGEEQEGAPRPILPHLAAAAKE